MCSSYSVQYDIISTLKREECCMTAKSKKDHKLHFLSVLIADQVLNMVSRGKYLSQGSGQG